MQTASPGELRGARRHRLTVVVRAVAIVVIVCGSAAALYAERHTIAAGLRPFRQANAGWAAAGFGAEVVSMLSFALLQRELLRAAGTRLTFGALLAIAYTSNAITVAVPVVGSAMALAYSQRQFRARGADFARVSLALLVSGAVSTVAFAVVVAAGAVISGNLAAAALGLLGSTGLAAVTGALVAVLHSGRGRARLERVVAWLLRLSQRVARRPAGDPGAIAAGVLERLGSFGLSFPVITVSFGYALVNWVTDVLCLAAAITAIGTGVPWDRLLLVWSAGAAAASFSPTPYGLGVVDIAMVVALHAAGLGLPDAVGAVLLYRVISFKIVVTLVWIGYRSLKERSRTRGSPAADVPR